MAHLGNASLATPPAPLIITDQLPHQGTHLGMATFQDYTVVEPAPVLDGQIYPRGDYSPRSAG
jgi:hypothetical protein